MATLTRSTRIQRGFTLVEMTVALMLLSFITLIGYQSLMFGLEQWQQGNDKMAFHYNYFQAVGWMRGKLGAAEKVGKPDGSRGYLFRGEADEIEFVARYSRARRGGLYVNRINFAPGQNLVAVDYYLHHPDNHGSNIKRQGVTLLEDVTALRFSYFGSQPGHNATWHSSWTDTTTLPRLVRMQLIDSKGEQFETTIEIATSNNV